MADLVISLCELILFSMRFTKAKKIELPEMAFSAKPDNSQPEMRLCEAPNCSELGEFPAPKSRNNLREYRYFCLAHVRDYNKNWNYFSGMEGAALEQAIRDATSWERPSWKFGTSAGTAHRPENLNDVFGLFEDDITTTKDAAMAQLPAEERQAWACLGIDPTTDKAVLKKRYNQLVKKHHPDKHQGDQKAQEKLKEINLAYSYLRKKLATQ